jgi:catechol 2,3-dioxygenase-like lactoylglutathione lyase family enzyme
MSLLGRPVQIAYSARGENSLEEAAEIFRDRTHCGPFVFAHHIELSSCTINGATSTFDHSSAYGWWGEVMVELVREHSEPLGPSPTGLHHLAFMVDSLPAGIDWCAQQGWPLTLHAQTSGGQEFVFCDARHDLGHFIEMYEPSDRLLGFYDYVRQLSQTPS